VFIIIYIAYFTAVHQVLKRVWIS